MKLGKLSPRVDARSLKLAHYLLPAVIPTVVDYSHKVSDWPVYANDRLGDCTCAAAGHMEQLFGALAGAPITPTEAQVIQLYDRVNGGTDNGAAMLDVLKAWRSHGLAGDGPLAFAQVDPLNHDHVRLAIQLFGGLYLGLAMPTSAQAQVGKTWTVGNAAGSWGGHAVNVVAFNSRYVGVETWGRYQRMTWAFWRKYVDEAWAVIPRSWKGAGMDVTALQADLAEL